MCNENFEIIKGQKPCIIDDPEVDGHGFEPTEAMKETKDLLSIEKLAQRSRTNPDRIIHDWLEKGQIVGWKDGGCGYVFPAGQFDKHGLRRKELDLLMELFDNIYELWDWLITPDNALDGEAPLALLERGELDCVEAAAKGYLQGDFG